MSARPMAEASSGRVLPMSGQCGLALSARTASRYTTSARSRMPRFTEQPVVRASCSMKGRATWRTCAPASSGWLSDSTPLPRRYFCSAGSRVR